MLNQVKTKNKSVKTKTTIPKERRIDAVIKDLISEHHALVQLNASIYKKAYLVELVYTDECISDKSFYKEFPRFRNYIEKKIPLFDLLEYYAYKPLIALDSTDLLNRVDNSAFRTLRMKLVKLSTGEIHPKAQAVLNALPKNEIINEIHVRNILHEHGIKARQLLEGSAPRVKKIGYTKDQLKKLTKNDLVELCLKQQKSLFRYKNKNKA